ncbi:MAG TPA: peroxidase family protein [Pseudorhizobium sp.]|nr:peroxidase family protein [Pseudorhizobium sp.]
MVTYIRSDLDFILKQIQIAEAHAAGQPLYGPGGLIPTYNIAWGLRTVDGSYNHLLPGQEQWGASDRPFTELMNPTYRTVTGTVDINGPAPGGEVPFPFPYTPGVDPDGPMPNAGPGDVIDPSVRLISNLLVDQTLGNPAAILTALQNAGIDDPGMLITAQISSLYSPLKPLFKTLQEAARAEAEAAAAADAADPASPGYAALQQAAADAADALAAARSDIDLAAGPAPGGNGLFPLLAANGIELDGSNVHIPNFAPDEGLSAPFNSWFTLFGQFFDHGLDLVNKGGSGTVMIPLSPDDPLYVEGSNTNFMVLTRATVGAGEDEIWGTSDDVRPVNTTTAYVDQNQTYTSHPSHQVFLRQYVATPDGPAATGKLMEGANGGMATWGEVKEQAATLLGIQLTDFDVGKVPLLRTDAYGNFIPGANGYPQLIIGIGEDGIPNTADDEVVEGNPADPVDPSNVFGAVAPAVPVEAVRTNHAFLADIAHNAVPTGLADGDITIGLENPGNEPGVYDNELLDAHFVAGDGRANENIGLTAVHHVFHSEHNRLVEHTKEVVLADAQEMLAGGASQAEATAFLNEWLAVDVTTVPASPTGLAWDGERLFQAAKFGTEMQYQHLVFEEFARKVQPTINTFLVPDGFDTMMDPSIFAEFAHVVYRFGHSMLTESIDQFDASFNPNHVSLIQGFLNPTAFTSVNGVNDDIAAGAIIRGMTRQVGNEIDEFVTSALRNNLLGLPLDLATINLARGRDVGVPSLNEARRTFYDATNQDARLAPYESWVDYAGHLKHEASIINFIAAYGTHALITGQTTIEGKRDAALTIITGVSVGGLTVPADAEAFLNGTGEYADDLGGLENVDLWIGGLAEEIMPFGGMLGSTFNFVFEQQMELLQSGDRFYYLQRLDGLHLFGEMENNSFAAMIMRNTDATHLPSDVFSTPGLILEVDQTKQFNDLDGDGTLESADPVGGGLLTPLVIRGPNSLRYTGDDHVVMGGTEANDTITAGIGDDTLFGDGGNDVLQGGFGNDIINGGDGDDIIKDSGGDDNIKGGAGNDVIHAGPGLDLVLAGSGQDFVFLGTDEGSEVFAGTGNDFIYGNRNAERILGNEGNDWIETGTFDGAPGDNFDEIFAHDGIDGHDVFLGDGGFDEFIGEGGDDIMVGSAGRGKMVGMSGFDWATYKDNIMGVNANLSIPIVFDEAPTLPQNAALDEYEAMEGLSGSRFNDILTGTEDTAADRAPLSQGGTTGYRGSVLTAEGIALINGLQELLGAGVTSFDGGDIILGGDGSDVLQGLAGDDIIDGDKWLDVQIGVFAPGDTEHAGAPIALHNSMTTLANDMFAGLINPGQLSIVRTIRNSSEQEAAGETIDSDGMADLDRVVFSGTRSEYDINFNANGTITVAHVGGLATDGTDTLRNVEILDFTDQDITLAAPTLDLTGDSTATTTVTVAQAFRDDFTSSAYNNNNGTSNWAGSWTEGNDTGGAATGDIRVAGGDLQFIAGTDGNESIARAANLTGVTRATLSFDWEADDLDGGETVQVQVRNTLNGPWSNLGAPLGGNQDQVGTFSMQLPAGMIGASTQIRFITNGSFETGENFYIDNVNIATETDTITPVPGAPGNDYETTYTENGAPVAIASGVAITDDGATIASARVVITNASEGDLLAVQGGLPGGIAAQVSPLSNGQLVLTLTGTTSIANYRAALQLVRYSSTSNNPDTTDRLIQVTVNDGLLDSNVATATVNVVAANDAPAGNADTVITNVASGVAFSVSHAALLANDTDPEGAALTITAVNGNGLTVSNGAGAVSVTDTGAPGGSFNYVASDGSLIDPTTTVSVTRVTGTINGGAGNEIIVGNSQGTAINGGGGNDHIDAGDGGDTISGGTGDDVIRAGTGNDTIVWNANNSGDTDGFDIVNGQEGGADTFQLNGRQSVSETFRIYARVEAIAAGIAVMGADSEIVITRTVGQTTSVIAELDNIEEIVVNTFNTTANNGNNPTTPDGTTILGDVIEVIGNFNSPFTSLNFSTITIDGNSGDDTVDISALTSAHRIVFRSNGGNDTIIGTLRPQDVVELPAGTTIADYEVTIDEETGQVELVGDEHTISFTAANGLPQFSSDGDEVDDDDDQDPPVDTNEGSASVPRMLVGTSAADILIGAAVNDTLLGGGAGDILAGEGGNDILRGEDGDDVMTGGDGADTMSGGAGNDELHGGSGADMLFGNNGADMVYGDGGDDFIEAGAGDDKAWGGAGDDEVLATAADGSDQYWGDEGNDTLNYSVATGNLKIDLGNGFMGRGQVTGNGGTDMFYGFENFIGGSGHDVITATSAANILDGGLGNDTFRFQSASAAHGDTIYGFAPGDKIDFSAMDANTTTAGKQPFTLNAGSALTAAGQVAVSYDVREGEEVTLVRGSIDGDPAAEFELTLIGRHTLTANDFNGVS